MSVKYPVAIQIDGKLVSILELEPIEANMMTDSEYVQRAFDSLLEDYQQKIDPDKTTTNARICLIRFKTKD